MYTALIVVHVISCFAVIVVVLLSKGKGADLGAAFGGSSQTVFGSQGAGGMMTKLVGACFGIFMLTSLGIAYHSSHLTERSVMSRVESTAPAAIPSGSAQETPSESVAQPVAQEPGPAPGGGGQDAAR